ncbi:juvenile hormone epoxide hydrolase-like [Epargyreus clarus]|uniref:juvenile hormone epoxide hydrolase-like n=1 Tax=Epargyreus clarus TaxID=520877 RepID=UPI003C2CA3E1
MAQKSKKKKDSENVGKSKTEKKSNSTKTSSSSGCSKIACLVTLGVAVAIAAAAVKVYLDVTTVPDLPKIDLEEWWGPANVKTKNTSVRRFRAIFSDAMLEGMRKKSETYRQGSYYRAMRSVNESWSYGVNSDTFAQVFAHWQFKYQYRDRARFLNKLDHYKTNIQGLDMHFLHVKPEVKDNVKVLPLLLIHGWPGSVREFYEAIPLLTTVRPGYDFVFEVIAPSLPGFVYSQGPARKGLNPLKIAVILRNLMQRLGFNKFYVQGGDLGHLIGSHLATIFPDQVLGFHTNFPVNLSKQADWVWILGSIWPTLVADNVDKMYPLTDKVSYMLEETGYLHLQGTKPDTIGIALQDSPVGLLAYTMDRILMFSNPHNKDLPDGGLSNFSPTDILDNVMLYWSTNSITTALRLYKEIFSSYDLEQTLAKVPTPVPTWGLRAKHEFFHSPDFVLRWKYPNLVGTTNLDVGGRFIAFEKPAEFSNDVFKAVQSFLKYKK